MRSPKRPARQLRCGAKRLRKIVRLKNVHGFSVRLLTEPLPDLVLLDTDIKPQEEAPSVKNTAMLENKSGQFHGHHSAVFHGRQQWSARCWGKSYGKTFAPFPRVLEPWLAGVGRRSCRGRVSVCG